MAAIRGLPPTPRAIPSRTAVYYTVAGQPGRARAATAAPSPSVSASTHPALPSANPLTARRLLRFLLRLRRVMPQPPSSGPALLVPVPSARGGTRAVDFILLPRGGSWARRGVLGWGFPLLGLWEVPSPAARAGAPLGRSAAPRAWCACRAACSLVLFGCGVLWPASGGFLCGVRWLSPLRHSTLLA